MGGGGLEYGVCLEKQINMLGEKTRKGSGGAFDKGHPTSQPTVHVSSSLAVTFTSKDNRHCVKPIAASLVSSPLGYLPTPSVTTTPRHSLLNTHPLTTTVAAVEGRRALPILTENSFELQDYPDNAADRRDTQRPESKRERKRREKLEQILEEAEMKFSHSLQFNSVPDWSSHYIAYSNLKKAYVYRRLRRRRYSTKLPTYNHVIL
jgi:hypothetical protein